jgi:peptide/nickel transport system permease protein
MICQSEYIKGAETIGASNIQILFLHLLPNLASMILVQASLLLSAAILVEASLSVLGLGARLPVP